MTSTLIDERVTYTLGFESALQVVIDTIRLAFGSSIKRETM